LSNSAFFVICVIFFEQKTSKKRKACDAASFAQHHTLFVCLCLFLKNKQEIHKTHLQDFLFDV